MQNKANIANRPMPEAVKIIQVIKTFSTIGDGTEESPVRRLCRYWTMDGKLLCEEDDINRDINMEGVI